MHPDSAPDGLRHPAGPGAPGSPYAAKFSLPWSIAAAVVDGDLTSARTSRTRSADPRWNALPGWVRWDVAPTGGPAADAPGPAPITLVDGSARSGSVARSAGGPDNPLTDEQLVAKFHGNAGGDTADARRPAVASLDELRTPSNRSWRRWPPPVQEGPPDDTTRHQTRPPSAGSRTTGFTFCLGLAEGDAAWTSGHTSAAFDEAVGKMTVIGDMAAQARTAYEKVPTILAAAGFGPHDVTRVTENVTVAGLADYEAAAAVRAGGLRRPRARAADGRRRAARAAYRAAGGRAARGPRRRRGAGRQRAPRGRHLAAFTVRPATTARSTCRRCSRSTPPAPWSTRATSPLSTPTAWTGRASCSRRPGCPSTRRHDLRLLDAGHPRRLPQDATACGKERLGGAGVYPGAGGILMSRLHHPDALVAIDVTASRHPLELVNPGWSRYDTLTYAPGVRAGRTLYMSGFAALDMQTQQALHPDDIVAQAEATYGSILHLLRHAGLGPEHLLETTDTASSPRCRRTGASPACANGCSPALAGVDRSDLQGPAAPRVPARGVPDGAVPVRTVGVTA